MGPVAHGVATKCSRHRGVLSPPPTAGSVGPRSRRGTDRGQFYANEVHFSGFGELFICSFSLSLSLSFFFSFSSLFSLSFAARMSPSPQPRTRFAPDCRWRTGKRSCYREGNQYLGPCDGRRGLAGTERRRGGAEQAAIGGEGYYGEGG